LQPTIFEACWVSGYKGHGFFSTIDFISPLFYPCPHPPYFFDKKYRWKVTYDFPSQKGGI
jgi:hypothetical protein